MRKSFKYGILTLAAAFACLLSGCGAEKKHQIGVDGYVYVAETIERNADGSSRRFTVSGDYLYYLNKFNAVKRVLLDEFLGGGGLSGGEIVFSVSRALACMDETEDRYSFFLTSIRDYAVDEEGSIYCILVVQNRIAFEYTDDAAADTGESSAQGILYKLSSDGEIVYNIKLPELRILLGNSDWLALDDKGRVYVLTAEAILAVDTDGTVKGSLPVELAINFQDKRGASGRLLEGENGAVYYVKEDQGSSIVETYLLNDGETLQMTPVSFLSARSGMELCEGLDGLLRVTFGSLYRCDVAKNSMEEILKWGDSSLVGEDVREVAQITANHYLVRDSEIKLLTKTPVEELPERENIVIASLYPSSDLRRCAVEFNLASEKYHVSIESYSGDPEGMYVRLDADLVSRDAPDILDFSGLDVSKYAEREMLEDLTPYLEREDSIGREDYLGNLLEGYTIKNRLVCIPKKFSAWVFWWLPRDTGGQGGWGMEEFMALAEKYPDRRVFSRDPSLFGTEYLLQEFCAPYYLERFVDWEEGTCCFDSEKFRSFLEWVWIQDRKDEQAQEALLGEHQLDFDLYEYYRVRHGDDTVMRGYPSVDGEEVYIAGAEDALGILADSEHKDGAWEFLRYFLMDLGDGNNLPTRKVLLEEIIQEEMEEKKGKTFYINRVPVEVPVLKKEHADLVMQVIESIDFTPRSSPENDIVDIVWEEAQYLLDGSKPAEEVARTIQNRAELVLQER